MEGSRCQNGRIRNAFKILTGTLTGKRPLGWPSRRWEDNIGMDPKETGISMRSWLDSARNRIVGESL